MKSNAVFFQVAAGAVVLAGLVLFWIYKSTQTAYNNPLSTPYDYSVGQDSEGQKPGIPSVNPQDLSTLPFPYNTRWLEKLPGSKTALIFKKEIAPISYAVEFTGSSALPFSSADELRSIVSEMVPALPLDNKPIVLPDIADPADK
jgi:hypothetical protein